MTGVSGSASQAVQERSLRILFVVRGATLHRFSLLIPALAERGHDVHIAFAPNEDWKASGQTALRPKVQELVDDLCSRYPQVTYSLAPQRDGSTAGAASLPRCGESPTWRSHRTAASQARAARGRGCAHAPGCSRGSNRQAGWSRSASG